MLHFSKLASFDVPIFYFSEPNFLIFNIFFIDTKFQILKEWISAFSSNFDKEFSILGL